MKVYRCKCFQKLKGKPTNFLTNNKIKCPFCGKIQYIDYKPIDFVKIIEEERKGGNVV